MRLIDADAFTEYVFDKWIQNDISNGDWTTFREWMNLQETIVEFDGDITKVIVKGVEYFPQETGKWSRESTPSTMNFYWYRCSVCGATSENDTKYCSHCGARTVNENG